MADLVLSSVLQVIVDKLADFLVGKFSQYFSDFKDNLQKLQQTLTMVQAILEDAEEQQATNKVVGIWLSKFKDVAYCAEDMLLLFSDNYFFFYWKRGRRDEFEEMLLALETAAKEGLSLNLSKRIVAQREWNRRETSSFVIESKVYGREKDKEEIVKLILSCETSLGGEATCIPIVGMGGIGKTTLAQLAYNDHKVTQHFDVKVWVFVSDHFDVKNIMMKVIESITNDKCHYSYMDTLHSAVRSLLRNKRYLIVLDDVWTQDHDDWDKLRPLFGGGLDGSKIIITTRSKRVAFVADLPTFPYYLRELSEDACWSMFAQRAFRRGEEENHPTLLPIGLQIVRKCGGLALAAKTLGSLMRFKREVREWMFVRDSELWKLDECESGILPALKLSYSHLPLHLKRCLSFCSIFPRSFEFKKEKLIHLWMAEGLLQSNSSSTGKEPEDIGNDYFTDLEWMSFFQEIKQCENVVIRYKMHDIIYDLLQSVTSSDYTILNLCSATPSSLKGVRHSSVVCNFRSSTISEELFKEDHHLRTLLLFSGGNLEALPQNFCSRVKSLFVLDLSGSSLTKLEGSLGALWHLTYLDLSHTLIKLLPYEIGSLHSLQTLNLFNCYNLLSLPDLLKMKSLRHLNNDGCRKLTGMLNYGNLPFLCPFLQLQTLPLFVIGDDDDGNLLQFLKLRGNLKITHLENLESWMMESTNLEGIESLGLYWGTHEDCPNINPEGEFVASRFQERKETQSSGPSQGIQPGEEFDSVKGEEVLSAFKPPHNLKRLLIKGYPGFKFPNWDVPHVDVVYLIKCRNSKCLPSLGNLQFLTTLSLQEMHGVKCIGKDFYCEGNNRPFPVLRELVIVDFPNLEEWLSPDTSGDAFPSLRKLILNKCPKLTVMPQILGIRHLDLRECCATLLHSFQNLRSLETLVIEGVKDLSHISGAFPLTNLFLTILEVKSCDQLSLLSNDLKRLTSLKSLVIRWCGKLRSLPNGLQYLSALESLEIGDCYSLTSLPEDGNRGLNNLRSLSIENCNNLNSVSMGFQYLTSLEILNIMYCPSIVALPHSVEHLSALRSLSIVYCPHLMCLPEELQDLMLLHSLEIRRCHGLKLLPDWIEKLVSLRSLAISGCHSITFLPEGVKCLTALQHLSIQDCPQLQQRCRSESGEDWPKIAHVPYKHIELPNLKRPREEGSSSSNY